MAVTLKRALALSGRPLGVLEVPEVGLNAVAFLVLCDASQSGM